MSDGEQPGPADGASGRPLVGIAMILAAVFFFAGMDAATKYLASRYPATMVLAVRFGIATGLMTVLLLPRFGRTMVTWHRPGIVLARSLAMISGGLMATLAFQRMPVAETVAIVYLAPFGVLLLSWPVLHERVGGSAWVATFGGFLGLLMIVRPGGGLAPDGIVFALLASVGTMWYFLFTRMLALTEHTLALLYGVNLTATVAFGLTLPWSLAGPAPSIAELGVFLFAGSASVIGHYLLTAAYREAPAAVLAPMNYVHLIWAGLLGWVVFDHIPDPLAMTGIALIAASGASLTLWTRITGRRRMRPPTG